MKIDRWMSMTGAIYAIYYLSLDNTRMRVVLAPDSDSSSLSEFNTAVGSNF
jgi:hypothetical protein